MKISDTKEATKMATPVPAQSSYPLDQHIIIALTKGRILNETLPLLAAAGIEPKEKISQSRKLIFETNQPGLRLLVIRGVDVPTYVEHGAADMGVAGKDILLEADGADLYEPLDLNIAKCRLMTATLIGKQLPQGRIRIATKFVNIAKQYCAEKGIQADMIKLYGAMELAPLMGLADMIVDVVDTGNTLTANGMESRDLIAKVSTRLVVNPAAMKRKYRRIQQLIGRLQDVVGARN